MIKKKVQTSYLTWIFLSATIFFFLTTIILTATIIIQNQKISNIESQNQQLLDDARSLIVTAEASSKAVMLMEEYTELYISARESSVDVLFDFIKVKEQLARLDPNNPDFTLIDMAYFQLQANMDNNKQIINSFIKFTDQNKDALKFYVSTDLEKIKNEYNNLLNETSKTQKSVKQQINLEKVTYGFQPIP